MGLLLLCATTGLLGLAVLLYWMLSTGYLQKKRIIDKIDGPPARPLIGNSHLIRFGNAFYERIIEFTETYREPGMMRVWLGVVPVVAVYKATTVQALLTGSKNNQKSSFYNFLHPWLGTGLLTSTGEKWQTRRKLITPSFHFKILSDFLTVFNEQSQIMVAKLEQKAGNGEFNIFQDITLCALDIICDTAMGKNVNAQNDSESPYVKAVYRISELVQHRQLAPWLWPEFLFSLLGAKAKQDACINTLQSFTIQVIKERHAELQEYLKKNPGKSPSLMEEHDEDLGYRKKKRLAFLDMLLYAAGEAKLTFEDIREEVDTFMFEGHDTTAAALNWAIHLIGCHPHVQQQLHDEMDQVFGDDDRPVTTEDMKDLKYTECVIKESLRLFPSVPLYGRTLSEDCEIGGHIVPKGTDVLLLTSALHRDAEFFPDPEKFDPERFRPENASGRHPYCYLPFSAGSRNCIGQRFAINEEKVILSSILRNFSIESTTKTEDLKPIGELILRPTNGIWVKLTKRITLTT